MYRRFAFEGEIDESLACVPMTVRRKLDVVRIKVPLAGWRTLSRAERLALCHLPIDGEEERAAYRDVLRDFAARAAISLGDLPDPDAAKTWNASAVPETVAKRLAALGASLDDASWRRLDELERYVLHKLADPKRDDARLRDAAIELGLLA